MAENKKVNRHSKKDLVEFEIPLTFNPEIDDQPFFASHNFKNYIIKPGVKVLVPKAIKDNYEASQAAKKAAYEYARKKALREPK